ncbi:hypothetical protein [Streptomyces sp. NPDC057253]|uniref:hypothetical protein n=1 Tax=Streptomyces sp. NPDC057253 TaxID=3346069 RepID=UPI0036276F54
MNVLLCATCGTRPTEPVRRLDAMSEYPGRDGLPGCSRCETRLVAGAVRVEGAA